MVAGRGIVVRMRLGERKRMSEDDDRDLILFSIRGRNVFLALFHLVGNFPQRLIFLHGGSIIVAEKATTLQSADNLVILICTLAKREDVSLAV